MFVQFYNEYIDTSAGREAREDARVVRVPAPPDAAGSGAAEAADGGERARPARARAAAHTAARHGIRHRYAQPHQWHTLCADQVMPTYILVINLK